MNYVALYRKYRPKTFDDVIGQEHIIATLRNQILNDRITHAYLFTGTRGTGKTSTARIFAHAVNCPHAAQHNGNPCGECVCCRDSGSAGLDIIEMDAASNNGVEYAREIREKVQFPPVNGRYKVYIIDEVHMLSLPAFNALLKTLEEPPAHVIFILGTTEVHKLPATILSRCMRFDFRLVPTPLLADHIARIYDAEGKKYTREAVSAIAQAGEGSVRDAISIADRCFAMSEGELTYADVMSILGVTSRTGIANLAKAVFTNNAAAILTEINRIVSDGKDIARLNKDMSVYIKDLLTVKLCDNAKQMLMLPDDIYSSLSELAASVTANKLLFALEKCVDLEVSLRSALSPLVLFESAMLRIACSSGEVDCDGLERRLTRLEQLPQNITEGNNLYVVDKRDASSIWRGVKLSIDSKKDPLLSGVWSDVKVEFDPNGNFVIKCTEGSYWLIENKYKKRLQAEIAVFCDKKVIVQLEESVTSSDIERQLKALGPDVKFEDE